MEITIRADAGDARQASEWLGAVAAAQGVPAAHVVRLDHCLDEALANVIMHGGASARVAGVQLSFCVRRAPGACTAELLIVDAGVEFDCSALPAAPRCKPVSLDEADPGGLGLLMLRTFSDDLTYRRSDGRNHLTICISWAEAT